MPAVVRKIRITLQISPLSGSFTIFHLFPAFAERNSKLDFTSEGIQPCSGSGRHASWPRPCCKIRRHGLWIKLRPHRPCYGLSPIAMRAIVALLKMGLRRITYLVSANDEMRYSDRVCAQLRKPWLHSHIRRIAMKPSNVSCDRELWMQHVSWLKPFFECFWKSTWKFDLFLDFPWLRIYSPKS
jgi:hypothetical protein